MRIYELAKKNNVTSKEVKDILDKLGIEYKTHSSAVPSERIDEVESIISNKGGKSKPKEKKKTEEASKKETKSQTKAKSSSKKETKSQTKAKSSSKKDSKKKDDESEEVDIVLDDKPITLGVSAEVDSEIQVYEEEYARGKGGARPHKKKQKANKEKSTQSEEVTKEVPSGPIKLWDGIIVKEMAELTGVAASEIIKKLFLLGLTATINHPLDKDTILILADELKVEVEFSEKEKEKEAEDEVVEEEPSDESEGVDLLESRPPVVTIMGHVNHGKTTLLDTLRDSRITEGESGGITQHIGAYMVKHDGHDICFIDTPGHQAFSSMRSMGANVTDIVILVVAANEGIQPQTLECIQHAKEAEVPIIIAMNKMDTPGANPDKVKAELAENGVTPEDWGGDHLCVPMSALKGEGMNELLDAINLQAELLELRSNPKGKTFGIVLESCQTDHMGPLVTVLVKNGKFHVGDSLVCGHVYGKIRRMEDDLGKAVKVAKPSSPVRIFGFAGVPEVSGRVKVFANDKEAKAFAAQEEQERRHKHLKRKDTMTVESLLSTIKSDGKKELKVILKSDVLGSVDAIKNLVTSIPSEKVSLKIIQTSTGTVTDTDISLAAAYKAIIVAYRVKVAPSAQSLAKREGVDFREYDIIYQVYEDIRQIMEGMLEKEYEEFHIGTAEVKQLFRISKVGVIAGCLIVHGKVLRSAICRISRSGVPGEISYKLATLKHYKDEVNEVRGGTECGIALEGFTDYQVGDKLEFYELKEKTLAL